MDTELKQITLPLEVFDGRFTIEQVGAIAILMGIPLMNADRVAYWGIDKSFMPIINGLVTDGSATLHTQPDGSVKLEIDLT